MFGFFASYSRDVSGSILPLTALMLPLVLGVTGLGVDVSMWIKNKRDLQGAADAAALAAAWETLYDFDAGDAEEAALKEAIANGFENGEGNSIDIDFGADEDGNAMITVTIVNNEQQYFSQMISHNSFSSSVVAAAIVQTPVGDYCMLSLDPEADGAITTNGNVTIDSAGCGIAVNSNSDEALSIGGSSDITVSDLSVVGDIEITGGRANVDSGSTDTGAAPVQDPYADLEAPEINYPADCDYNNYSATGDATLDPGVYCGGIRLSGNGTVTFNEGVYILYAGDLQITGNTGDVIAEGVTFIFTGSEDDGYGNAEISGGRNMYFSAPLEGELDADYEDFEGVAFYQDRNAEDSVHQCNSIVGTAAVDVVGAAYFPSRCLNIGGDAQDLASSDSPCSRIIAKRIIMHGNPNIGNECDGIPVEDFAPQNVRLVL